MTLRLVTAEPPTPGERLAQLLTVNHADGRSETGAACERSAADGLVRQDDGFWCDPSWDRHGLAWWYPHMLELVGVRSSGGRNGSGGAVAVPIDLDALDFLAGKYWVSDEPPTDDTLDDPDSYRAGLVPTVIALEQSARAALRLGPRPRPRAEGYDGLSYDDRVPAALAWMAGQADQLVDEAPLFADTLRTEAIRLLARSAAMLLGNRFAATVNDCMYCEQPTVIADEDRAFCRNPECRRPDGARYCWRYDDTMWVEVDEPDVRGRGRLSEEDLSRWSGTG